MTKTMCSNCGKYRAIHHPIFIQDGDLCINCYFDKRNFVILSRGVHLEYYCQKHPTKTLTTTTYDITVERKQPSCPTCNYKEGARKRFDTKCSTSTITLRQHFRNISKQWKIDSQKNDNNCCRFTGITKNLQVHHSTMRYLNF